MDHGFVVRTGDGADAPVLLDLFDASIRARAVRRRLLPGQVLERRIDLDSLPGIAADPAYGSGSAARG